MALGVVGADVLVFVASLGDFDLIDYDQTNRQLSLLDDSLALFAQVTGGGTGGG